MNPRVGRAIGAVALLCAAATAEAEIRSAAMLVRVNVVRGCSFESNVNNASEGSVAVTCSRGNATGVVTSSSGVPARVVTVQPLRTTTIVPARLALIQSTTPTELRMGSPSRQLVTFNF